jgi:hypothetical protein
MRKFLTLMKTLTAFRNHRVRNTHQPTTLSVAYCNPALDCCASFNNTSTTDTLHNTSDDPDVSGSFFLQHDGEDHSQLLTLITSEIEHIQRQQRKDEPKKQNVVPLYERITYTPPVTLVANMNVLVPATVPVKNMLHPFNHFFTNLLFGMKHLFRRKSLYCLAILIAGICIANNVQAQTDAITFDFTGSTLGFGGNCSGDNTYTGGTSGNESVATTTITFGATINSITLDVEFGKFGYGGTTVTFYLNGNSIGSLSAGSFNFCTSGTISSIDPTYLNPDGPNTISYSATSGNTAVYNATLNVNYSVCTPPAPPSIPGPEDFCLDATATALTATGDNLLWYTAPDDPTGSPDAPVPTTDNTGTTAFYVTQTIGCESAKAEIDVTVNPLPTTSVAGFSNISCFGASDGSITVQGNDGSGSYEYSIDDGATWTSTFSSDPYQFMGLSAQEYKIQVKDSNGCISKEIQ